MIAIRALEIPLRPQKIRGRDGSQGPHVPSGQQRAERIEAANQRSVFSSNHVRAAAATRHPPNHSEISPSPAIEQPMSISGAYVDATDSYRAAGTRACLGLNSTPAVETTWARFNADLRISLLRASARPTTCGAVHDRWNRGREQRTLSLNLRTLRCRCRSSGQLENQTHYMHMA
jgi:hypothetical protein